jgi:hypothetical protein
MSRRVLTTAALALGLAAPALAQLGGGGFGGGLGGQGIPLSAQIRQNESRLQALTNEYDVEKARVEAGVATTANLEAMRSEIEQIKIALEAQKGQQAAIERVERLQKPVDVQLRDATVRQAAQALSQASGVPITVDRRITNARRISLEAQEIPLGIVLETMAEQTELMIDPEGPGVALKPWPGIQVNGVAQTYVGRLAPWGDRWGYSPTNSIPNFGSASRRVQEQLTLGVPLQQQTFGAARGAAPAGGAPGAPAATPTELSGAPGKPSQEGAPSGGGALPSPTTLYQGALGGGGLGGGYGFMPGGASMLGGPGGVSIAPLSDRMIAVAEPGTGPQGEAGVLLTAYRFDGKRFVKVGSTFHRLTAAGLGGIQLMPGMGGYGGGYGGGGGGFGGAQPDVYTLPRGEAGLPDERRVPSPAGPAEGARAPLSRRSGGSTSPATRERKAAPRQTAPPPTKK